MNSTFFARRSLLILVIVFFLVPFALRGARLSLRSMKNDIKDWLPNDFKETSELDWFRKHFMGEQFVICSWEGCTAEDERFRLLTQKLVPEDAPLPDMDDKQHADLVRMERFVGNYYGLFLPENCLENWGGLNEKWFQGRGDKWYYITPDGGLHVWKGQSTVLGLLGRSLSRLFWGKSVDGELVEQLAAIDHERPYRIEARLIKTVISGPKVLEQMSREGGPLRRGGEERTDEEARQVALERLKGYLFGPDGKQTCLIVTLTEEGKQNLERVVGRGLLGHPRGRLVCLAEDSGVHPPPRPPLLAIPSLGIGVPPEPPAPSLKIGGPPVDNVAIDEEGQITLVRLVGLCGLLGFGLSFVCFRSFKVTFMLFFVGGVAAIGSLGAVWWLGSSVDAVLMSMPAVVYVLGLSGAVHIVNYYRDAIEEHGTIDGAPERAVAHGFWPCSLAALTTAIGLISLCTSELKPIWKFGLFSAIGVMGTLFLLFTYLPSALQMWPPKLRLSSDRPGGKPSPLGRLISNCGETIGKGIIRYNVPVALSCTLVLVVFGLGLMNLKTSVHLIKMFDPDARIIRNYRWLENNIGKLVPMELVVRIEKRMLLNTGDEESPEGQTAEGDTAPGPDSSVPRLLKYTFLDRVQAAAWVHRVIEEEFGEQGNGVVGRGMSVATFAPDLPEAGGGFRQAVYRNSFSRKLEEHRDEFVDSDYLRDDETTGAELWRVSIRLAALRDIDYGAFVADLKRAVEPIMTAYRFRDQILRKILKDNNEEGFGGERVLVIGAAYKQYYEQAQEREEQSSPAPAEQIAEAAGEQPEAAAEAGLAKADLDATFEYHEVDQTRIFALTLKDLLKNARLQFRAHDPTRESAEDLQAELAEADYVILAADHPSYDLDAIARQLPDRVIDVRDHLYDPATAPPVPCVTAADRKHDGAETVYTGVVPVVYKAQRTLLNNLIYSIGLAFVTIAVVMWVFVLRSPSAALVSMLPNVFPVVLIFGAMGWMGISIDIGTMMTASVAMGVAVDDTIHFLTWYRWGLDAGLGRIGAIEEAYRRVGRAMAQTTAIGGLGMFVFALSTFTPTQRFGVMMLALLVAALVGDLVFLPALLAGPLGRVFSPSSKDKRRRAERGSPAAATDGVGPVAGGTEEKKLAAPTAVGRASGAATGGEETDAGAVPPHLANLSKDRSIVRHDAPHNVPQK